MACAGQRPAPENHRRLPVLSQKVGQLGIDGARRQADGQRQRHFASLLGDVSAGRLHRTGTKAGSLLRISIRAETQLRPAGKLGVPCHRRSDCRRPFLTAAGRVRLRVFGRAGLLPALGPGFGYAYGRAQAQRNRSRRAFWARPQYRLFVENASRPGHERRASIEILPGSTCGIASALITGDRGANIRTRTKQRRARRGGLGPCGAAIRRPAPCWGAGRSGLFWGGCVPMLRGRSFELRCATDQKMGRRLADAGRADTTIVLI